MAFVLIVTLNALLAALAVRYHMARLRELRTARKDGLLLDQLYQQSLDHADVDPFARVVLDEITSHKRKGIS